MSTEPIFNARPLMNSLHFETRPTLNAAPAKLPLKKLQLNKEALRTLTGSEKRATAEETKVVCWSQLLCTVTF
jgi:hypothetical protein